jgi:hypothetical protein
MLSPTLSLFRLWVVARAELVQNFDGRVMILIQFRSIGTLLIT